MHIISSLILRNKLIKPQRAIRRKHFYTKTINFNNFAQVNSRNEINKINRDIITIWVFPNGLANFTILSPSLPLLRPCSWLFPADELLEVTLYLQHEAWSSWGSQDMPSIYCLLNVVQLYWAAAGNRLLFIINVSSNCEKIKRLWSFVRYYILISLESTDTVCFCWRWLKTELRNMLKNYSRCQ